MKITFKQDIGEILSVISPEIFRAYNSVPTVNNPTLAEFITYIFERLLIKHYKLTLVGYVKTDTDKGDRLYNYDLLKLYETFIQLRPDFDVLFKQYINYHSMMDGGLTKVVINQDFLEFKVNE